MELKLTKGETSFVLKEDKISISEGFKVATYSLPATNFKKMVFNCFITNQSQSTSNGVGSLKVAKGTKGLPKLAIIVTDEETADKMQFNIFLPEIYGFLSSLRKKITCSSTFSISNGMLTFERRDKFFVVKSESGAETEINSDEAEIIWNTLMLRGYGHDANCVVRNISFFRNCVYFPYLNGKRGATYPLTLGDQAILLSEL